MRTELKRLHRMIGTTVVYVTHDQIEAMTLATRIAVMRGGLIEQIGSPEEIYNQPATLYVAQFMGSPPMNLLKATLDASGLRLDAAKEVLAAPGEVGRVGGRARKVIVGLRPEDLHLAPAAGDLTLNAKVDMVDLTGPDLVVSAFTAGQKLIASVAAHTKISPEAQLTFAFSAASLHLFDEKTGLRIPAPPTGSR